MGDQCHRYARPHLHLNNADFCSGIWFRRLASRRSTATHVPSSPARRRVSRWKTCNGNELSVERKQTRHKSRLMRDKLRKENVQTLVNNCRLCFRDPPVLGAYRNADVILRLPNGKRIRDIRWLSVWCRRFTVRILIFHCYQLSVYRTLLDCLRNVVFLIILISLPTSLDFQWSKWKGPQIIKMSIYRFSLSIN